MKRNEVDYSLTADRIPHPPLPFSPTRDTPPLREIQLGNLTSPAAAAAIHDGYTAVIIACGAVEQHGPHLPLFMDAAHGRELAMRLARRMGNALVAPPIQVGCSEHHMAFAGTISLREQTFQALCLDYAVSLSRHGFERILFVPTHGGNFGPLASALESFNQAVQPPARVSAFTDLHALIEMWKRVIEEESGLGSRVGGHADIAEGSIMLALHPELVREEEAAPGYLGELTDDLLRRMVAEGIGAISPNGVLGDPRGMTATMGERCMDAAVEMLVEYFGASS